MSTTITKFRHRLARLILFYNLLLIVVLVVLYLLNGFDDEEFSAVITLITAVSAIYLGTLFKRLASQLNPAPANAENETATVPDQPISDSHQLVRRLVPIHFLLILLILCLKAFAVITFQQMNIFLGIIEALFGAYMGQVISAIYAPLQGMKPKG